MTPVSDFVQESHVWLGSMEECKLGKASVLGGVSTDHTQGERPVETDPSDFRSLRRLRKSDGPRSLAGRPRSFPLLRNHAVWLVLYFARPEVRHWIVATFARTWANSLAGPPSAPSGEGAATAPFGPREVSPAYINSIGAPTPMTSVRKDEVAGGTDHSRGWAATVEGRGLCGQPFTND